MSKTSPTSGSVKVSGGLRAVQIITGVLALALAAVVMISPASAVVVAVVWLAISFLFGGIEGIVTGIWASHLSKGWRAFSIGAGIAAVGLSIAAFAFPGAAALTTLFLFSMALLILGAGGIARGLLEKRLAGWYRAMLIGVGGIALLLSVPVMIYPMMVGIPTLYVFISVALMVIGISYVIAGVSGAVFRPTEMVRSGLGRSWESDAA